MRSPKVSVFWISIAVSQGISCAPNNLHFQILPDRQVFRQNTESLIQKKVDILWVVDNSGSMAPFQAKLVENFNSFINSFKDRGYDFHIGVTTTDAYLSEPPFSKGEAYSLLRQGTPGSLTGYPVIDQNTPDVIEKFTINASQGSSGSGDERAFSSISATLRNSLNSNFRRSDAFLAIIVLSDEDDFSSETRLEGAASSGGSVYDHDYKSPQLDSVEAYISFLDHFTASPQGKERNYNVSAVTVLDEKCLAEHLQETAGTIIGQRYISLVDKTQGVLADICSADYARSLLDIQRRIIELTTHFHLERLPKVESISVHVNGDLVFEGKQNGWTYDYASNSIVFHGESLPKPGAIIEVNFDPQNPT